MWSNAVVRYFLPHNQELLSVYYMHFNQVSFQNGAYLPCLNKGWMNSLKKQLIKMYSHLFTQPSARSCSICDKPCWSAKWSIEGICSPLQMFCFYFSVCHTKVSHLHCKKVSINSDFTVFTLLLVTPALVYMPVIDLLNMIIIKFKFRSGKRLSFLVIWCQREHSDKPVNLDTLPC